MVATQDWGYCSDTTDCWVTVAILDGLGYCSRSQSWITVASLQVSAEDLAAAVPGMNTAAVPVIMQSPHLVRELFVLFCSVSLVYFPSRESTKIKTETSAKRDASEENTS